MSDRFYRSSARRMLRAAALARDDGRYTVCGTASAGIVDHVVSRRRGGPDTLANVRTLRRHCDNAIKEDASGKRRSGGVAPAHDARGQPLDPGHWRRRGGA